MRWPSFFGRAAAEKGPRTPEARPTGREWASVPARTPLTRLGGPEASAVQRLAMARPVAAETAQAVNGPARAESGPEPAAALVTAQRLTLGQSRRLGLGAPLSNPEASVVQRVVETPALDLAPPAHSARPDQAEA